MLQLTEVKDLIKYTLRLDYNLWAFLARCLSMLPVFTSKLKKLKE